MVKPGIILPSERHESICSKPMTVMLAKDPRSVMLEIMMVRGGTVSRVADFQSFGFQIHTITLITMLLLVVTSATGVLVTLQTRSMDSIRYHVIQTRMIRWRLEDNGWEIKHQVALLVDSFKITLLRIYILRWRKKPQNQDLQLWELQSKLCTSLSMILKIR